MNEKILIATKKVLPADMLKILINNRKMENNIDIVHDGKDALNYIIDERPRLILIDLYLPVLSALALMQELARINLYPQVICCAHEITPIIGVKLFKAGISGIIDYNTTMEEARQLLQKVETGKKIIPPYIKDAIEERDYEINHEKYTPLTIRQTEVLHLAGEGYSNAEIAYKLEISGKTVEKHKSKIRDKMGLASAMEISIFAITHGFVEVREVIC